jgi:lipoprotein NlpI
MVSCYIYSSIAYLQLSQHDQAIQLLNEVVNSDPERVQALIIRGRAFEMQGRDEFALKDLL